MGGGGGVVGDPPTEREEGGVQHGRELSVEMCECFAAGMRERTTLTWRNFYVRTNDLNLKIVRARSTIHENSRKGDVHEHSVLRQKGMLKKYAGHAQGCLRSTHSTRTNELCA